MQKLLVFKLAKVAGTSTVEYFEKLHVEGRLCKVYVIHSNFQPGDVDIQKMNDADVLFVTPIACRWFHKVFPEVIQERLSCVFLRDPIERFMSGLNYMSQITRWFPQANPKLAYPGKLMLDDRDFSPENTKENDIVFFIHVWYRIIDIPWKMQKIIALKDWSRDPTGVLKELGWQVQASSLPKSNTTRRLRWTFESLPEDLRKDIKQYFAPDYHWIESHQERHE